MTDAAGIEATLEERPDLEPALEAVLDVDDRHDTWTYEDLPIDSGTFGELVSRGIVKDAGDGYQLADPAAVRAALAGDEDAAPDTESATTERRPTVDLESILPASLDRTTAAIVAGAFAVFTLFRLVSLPSVYRNGDVVLSGNDPYLYRYWVEQAVAAGTSPLDLGTLAALPGGSQQGEPLTVATLWWLSALLGDGATAVGHVLAWYPVVAGLVLAGLVYLLAVRLTGDRRVGVAGILVLAIVPGHAFRTALGYADHHAFDYPWLAATALALLWLATVDRESLRSPATALVSLGLGVAVTGQVLAWEAGPLLVAPVGLVVAGRALVDVWADRSPLVAGAPVVAGLGLAALLTWLVHAVVDWHTTVVASAPALLFAGAVAALVAAAAVHRTTGDARHLAAADVLVLVAGVLGVRFGLPDAWRTLSNRLEFLFGGTPAVETVGLFSTSSFGFLLLLGLTLALALPTMVRGVRRSLIDGRWIVATTYAWYTFGLATLQTRFVGEFGAFAALFAGLGFVQLAAWVDLAEPVTFGGEEDGDRDIAGLRDGAGGVRDRLPALRVPDRRALAGLFALFVLFGAFGGMQTVVKTGQTTTEAATYDTAAAIEADANAHSLDYPENYVLSRWGKNRVYNYFVNGEANSYAYARETHESFITSNEPADWDEQLRDRVGYVVLEDHDSPPESTHARLFDAYGSRQTGVDGLGHYRAIYAHESGDRTAFEVVPGARLNGTAPADATVTVSTDVSIDGAAFTYERQVTANATGDYALRLAYPGEYTVTAGGETRTVTVPESAVRDGSAVAS